MSTDHPTDLHAALADNPALAAALRAAPSREAGLALLAEHGLSVNLSDRPLDDGELEQVVGGQGTSGAHRPGTCQMGLATQDWCKC